MQDMQELLEIMAALRDPETGCPWDIKQDFASIAPYSIEEAYEVADAIARQDWSDLEGELGDLLLQVVFHAQMAKEAGLFDFASVARRVNDKMIQRHPHVFGDAEIEDAEAQIEAWEASKSAERGDTAGALDGVALGLPALMRAEKLQRRAARVGFDWEDPEPVRAKVLEELEEFDTAQSEEHRAEEFGDLLFAVVNMGRHYGIDAETALRDANVKFERRFGNMETQIKAQGKALKETTLAEMEQVWQAAKAKEDA